METKNSNKQHVVYNVLSAFSWLLLSAAYFDHRHHGELKQNTIRAYIHNLKPYTRRCVYFAISPYNMDMLMHIRIFTNIPTLHCLQLRPSHNCIKIEEKQHQLCNLINVKKQVFFCDNEIVEREKKTSIVLMAEKLAKD